MATNYIPGDATFEEILSFHGLNKGDLDTKCSHSMRCDIAIKIVDWKTTGHFFGIPKEKLDAIEEESKTAEQRKIDLLEIWSQREGDRATLLKLAKILYHRGRRDLMDQMCHMIKASIEASGTKELAISSGMYLITISVHLILLCYSYAGINVEDSIETFQTTFKQLRKTLKAELVERIPVVPVDEVIDTITQLPIKLKLEYDKTIQEKLPELEKAQTITQLFNRLNPLFNFIDYTLLEYLISEFGSATLKENMKSYVQDIQKFMKETTIADMIPHWPGDNVQSNHFRELITKIGKDYKTYTLEELNQFRQKLCQKIKLSEVLFNIVRLDAASSFFVTWRVPSTVTATDLMAVRGRTQSLYRTENVQMILLDNKLIYSSYKVHVHVW